MGSDGAGKGWQRNAENSGELELTRPDSLPVSVVSYTSRGEGGKTMYMVRGFIASGDICGDLEFYSETPFHAGDPEMKKMLASYQLQQKYVPGFSDIFFYAQILYQSHMYSGGRANF